MPEKIFITCEDARKQAIKVLDSAPIGSIMVLRKPRRTDLQNRRLHASIRDIAEQVQWADGFLTEDEWKRLLVASLYGQKVVPGLLTGFVVLTKHTSDMSVSDVVELQEFIYAWGSERGVNWTEV